MATNKFNNLRVYVDNDKISESHKPVEISVIEFDEEEKESYPYNCTCELDIPCECGCRSLTETDILDVYHSIDILSYSDGWESGYRMDTLHVFGTKELSTDDVINYFLEFSPSRVEWIDDMCCNVVFTKESSTVRALINMSEKCTACNANEVNRVLNQEGSDNSDEELESKLQNYKNTPPPGKWRKAFSLPEAAEYIYLRYAHKSDIKEKGAEKKSRYYQKYGNPNFGGKAGLISNSHRKRTRLMRKSPDADLRQVKKSNDASKLNRQMVVYDGLYSDSDHSPEESSDDSYPKDRKSARVTNQKLKSKQMLTSMRMVADLEDNRRRIPASNRIGSSVHSRLNFDARKNISVKYNDARSHSSVKDRLGPTLSQDSKTDKKDLRKILSARSGSHRRRHRNSSDDSK